MTAINDSSRATTRSRAWFASAFLAVGTFVAACGGSTASVPAGTLTPAASTAPTGSSGPVIPSPVIPIVAIQATEYEFTPSTLSVAAGSVQFVVTNTGNDEHKFGIFRGDAMVAEIEGVMPGQAKDLSVTLAAGDYTFVCKLSGHDQLGMHGALTVTGS